MLPCLLLLFLAGPPFCGKHHAARHPGAVQLRGRLLRAGQAAVLLHTVALFPPILPLLLHQLMLCIELPLRTRLLRLLQQLLPCCRQHEAIHCWLERQPAADLA